MAVETTLDYAVAKLTDGSELRTPFWRLDSRQEGETFLVIAAQHGNEIQGCEVIRRFKEVCQEKLVRGTVYLVPFGNLLAIRHRRSHISLGPEQPYSDAEGHNMNGTWPGKADGNDTQRLAYSLHEAAVKHCTRCLDLHSWPKGSATCTLARQDNEMSRMMAEVSGIRFIQWRTPAKPQQRETSPAPNSERRQTLGAMFNDSGRGSITIELAPQWVISEKTVSQGLRAATNVAKVLGMMDGDPELPEGPVVSFSREETDERNHQVTAPCGGMFVEAGLETADHVEQGQKLGHIIRDEDLETVEIIAPVSGYLWQYGCFRVNHDVALPPQHPYASEGDTLAGVMSV